LKNTLEDPLKLLWLLLSLLSFLLLTALPLTDSYSIDQLLPPLLNTSTDSSLDLSTMSTTNQSFDAQLAAKRDAFLSELKDGKDLKDWIIVMGNEAGGEPRLPFYSHYYASS